MIYFFLFSFVSFSPLDQNHVIWSLTVMCNGQLSCVLCGFILFVYAE